MNETLKTINNLRSARNDFIDKKVPAQIMNTIIEHSMKAANASNVQRYSMILVDEPKILEVITNKNTAKIAIVYCLDYNRVIETAKYMGYDYIPGTDNWYDIISGIFDVSALAQTAVIAAASLGVDTVITNSVLRQNQKEIVNQLKLPEKYCIAVMAVLFGYRDIPRIVQNNRLAAEYIVHHNQYRTLNSEEHNDIIAGYDQFYPQYIDDAHPHYLDFFFNDWCGPKDERVNSALKERMKEAGFIIL
jgi:nitroreductase